MTSNGNPLQPQITIPAAAQSVNIATDGTVSYTLPGQSAAQIGGQITLANFQNPAGLNSLGQSLYSPTDASGAALVGPAGGTDGIGTIMQGYVEQSNVSVVDEFINLISSQRAYEANSKVVKAADDMYSAGQQHHSLKLKMTQPITKCPAALGLLVFLLAGSGLCSRAVYRLPETAFSAAILRLPTRDFAAFPRA